MTAPVLTAYFESGDGSQLVGAWQTNAIAGGLSEPTAITLTRSFGTLAIVVEGARVDSTHILVDGNPAQPQCLSGLLIVRVPFSYDIEYHRIALVHVPDRAFTLDITVAHEDKVNVSGLQQSVSKWTSKDFEREYARFEHGLTRQRQIVLDRTSRGMTLGTSAALNSVTVQVVGQLTNMLAGLRSADLVADFSEAVPTGIDREAVLSYLKQDARRLTKDPAGSISVASVRYTTDIDLRVLGKSSRVDLTAIVGLLDDCSALLGRSSAPAVASVLLRHASDDLRARFRISRMPRAVETDALLTRQMHSPRGAELQSHLRLLAACAQERAKRDSNDLGLLWLRQGVRDFDLFQSACFYLVARSFGLDSEAAASSQGILSAPGVTVLNGNRPGALDSFFSATPGWRQGSSQPSEYRPDIVVMLDGKLPVVLDAKFALSLSETLPLPSGPVKAVQAYLDEFDLPGAVLIVPKVLDQSALNAQGYVEVAGINRSGKRRLILGVPLQDPDSYISKGAVHAAVTAIASL